MENTMPKVMQCTVETCVYNLDRNCHAMAITMGDLGGEPACYTYFISEMSGHVPNDTAGVGACKLVDCKFNKNFECGSSGISVEMRNGEPDCLNYESL